IIIKIKKDYLGNCGINSINIDGFKSLAKSFPKHEISAKFPLENARFNQGKNTVRLAYNPLEGIYHLRFSSNIDIEKTLTALNTMPFVQYAEAVKIYNPLYRPNDPLADSLLADSVLTGKIYYHDGIPNQYHLAAIRAYDAWDITKGDTNVLIGVIDVAYDTTNVEIRGNVKFNSADPVDGIDNDGNGYTDDYWGWNVANGSGNIHEAPTGSTVHGSQVAGVIGAATDNGIGTAGIGFKCKIVPVKCWNGYGLQSTYDGIYYCVKRKCKVINCSWGGAGSPQQSEQDIINFAVANGAIVVAAAGNGTGQFYTEANFYPASYKNVLSVAQCLPDGKSFLSGPVNAVTYSRNVDLVAPSIDIFT
ncbi:MAG: S8 family serine peptidase, partial [Cytophagales bacterium]|nr:S8 family serine peptidase [Cytophagales bacterium]